MADFETSYTKTLSAEGGYSNHPADRGGETYKGISRRMHPGWGGWPFVDQYRLRTDFPRCLDRDGALQLYVRAFYRSEFWKPLRLDEVSSQAVADEVYDTAVNMGTGPAGRILQQGLNIMNGNGEHWSELKVDGKIGPTTLGVLEQCTRRGWDGELVVWMNVLQGSRYIDLMREHPDQEQFARGWSQRIQIVKTAA